MPKKPTAVFEAVFTGGGVYPEKMPLGKVSEALSAIKRLAMGEVFGAEDDDEDEAENEEVRLIDVQRSASAVFVKTQKIRVFSPRLKNSNALLTVAMIFLWSPSGSSVAFRLPIASSRIVW